MLRIPLSSTGFNLEEREEIVQKKAELLLNTFKTFKNPVTTKSAAMASNMHEFGNSPMRTTFLTLGNLTLYGIVSAVYGDKYSDKLLMDIANINHEVMGEESFAEDSAYVRRVWIPQNNFLELPNVKWYSHIVKKGESWESIGQLYGIDRVRVINLNNLFKDRKSRYLLPKLFVGEKLKIYLNSDEAAAYQTQNPDYLTREGKVSFKSYRDFVNAVRLGGGEEKLRMVLKFDGQFTTKSALSGFFIKMREGSNNDRDLFFIDRYSRK